MAKLTRKIAKLFGSAAGPTQIGEFGSLAAGSPAYSTDPAVIQSLSNWLGGWFSAVLGNNSPAIEDMNAMSYVFAYQLCYLMQEGVPEWEAGTTYYKGSFAQDGAGKLYISIFDGNLNNALTSTQYWLPFIQGPYAPVVRTYVSGSSTYIPSFLFTVVSANATLGDTYTNNGATFTVERTVAAGTTLICSTTSGAPSATGTLTKASGSGDSTIAFVKNIQPLYAYATLQGGGGGGGGSGASTGDGGNGVATTFGTSFLTANGGTGGTASLANVQPTTIPAVGTIVINAGADPINPLSGSPPSLFTGTGGTPGGASVFGRQGMPTTSGSGPGGNADANSGSGGAGGSNSGVSGGVGGAPGGYLKVKIYPLLTSYAVVVGTGGLAGLGTGGEAGGVGGSGTIIIEEHWQ